MRHSLLFLIGALCLGACVPNKKVVYLQKGDELKEEVPVDSVLRSYDLSTFDYRLQPEDILSVRIESLTEAEFDIFFRGQSGVANNNLTTLSVFGYLIDEDGYIQFPVVGKVKVAGLTVFEANDVIQKIANDYLEDATVYVRLLNFRVTIIGEVNGEGTISSINNRLTVMEAVGLAGGLTELADRSKIKIIRQAGSKAEVHYVNLLDEEFLNSPLYYVYQNDIIIVPPLKQRPFRRYFGQNVSVFVSSLSTLLLIINLINN